MTLDHALRYASLGWAVLPLYSLSAGRCTCGAADCKSPGKHPHRELVPHGVHNASTDPVRIREWWARVPDANVGIATGAASGFDVLDVDPRNGGDDTLADLQRDQGKLPDTALQLTGGQGYHYLFRHDPELRLRSPGRGLDVKSTGGYIVAEPSTHVSGGHYAWEGSADPTDGHPIADAPAWLAAPAPMRAAASGPTGTGYLDPQRIEDLRAALAHLDASDYQVWIGVGQALHSTAAPEAFDLWDVWSQGAGNYDGSTAVKWRTFNANGSLHVESIFVWSRDAGWDGESPRVAVPAENVLVFAPRAAEPVTPSVPPELLHLPGALGVVVDLANRTAPKPQPQFAVQAALALGCAVLGRRYRTTRENWPSLYLVNVGKSASGKEHARTVIDAVLTAAQLGHLMGPGGYTSDGAVFSAAMNQPCHLAIIDELGAMLGNAKATNNYQKRQALDALTQAWGLLHGSLRPLGYSTMTLTAQQRGELASRVIHRPAISLLGMTTPRTFYGALTEQAIEGGFLNRLLIVESNVGRAVSRQADPLQVPDSVVEWCQAARLPVGTGNLANIEPAHDQVPLPRVIDFTPDAKAAFRAYEAACLAAMDELEAEGLAELEGRSTEKALRIAQVVAVSDNVAAPLIHLEHAQWAIAYVSYYTTQTIEAVRQHMHGSIFAQWRAEVLEIIRRGGERGRTERELAQYSRTYAGLDPRQRKSLFDSLKGEGMVEFVQIKPLSGRGRVRQAWVALQEIDDAA